MRRHVASFPIVMVVVLVGACGDSTSPGSNDVAVDASPQPDWSSAPDTTTPLWDGRPVDSTGGGEGSLGDGPTGDLAGGEGIPGDAATDASAGTDALVADAFIADTVPPADTGPALACTSVTPPAANNTAAVTLTLDGYLFDQNATVELQDLVTQQVQQLGAATVADNDNDGIYDQAEVSVPANTPQGLYLVWIANPSTSDRVSCGTYSSTSQVAPTVTDVVPNTAWAGDPNDNLLSDQPITITGAGFSPVPTVQFVSVATKKTYQAATVGYINETGLTSICPSESLSMPVGDYYVDVINPSLLWARWTTGGQPGLFTVTSTPPPVIHDVSPFKIPVNAGGGNPIAAVTVTGDHFDSASQLLLLLPDGSTMDLTQYITAAQINATGTDMIEFNWDNTNEVGLPVGIYPLKLVNPDGQYDTFFSMLVEHAIPGKLNSDQWVAVSDLIYPRERHASTVGFDVFGNSYIYTIAGTSLPASASLSQRPRPVLANTEVSEVNVFGEPSQTSRILMQLDTSTNLATIDPKHDSIRTENLLNTARTGLTVVRAGDRIIAIGGAPADTWYPEVAGSVSALKSVEHTRILGYENRPNLSLPLSKPVSKGLPLGSWYYQVSAVVPGIGESLPSREVAALNASGQVLLKWLPVTGATSYLVYRSPASDGRANSTRLIRANVGSTFFVDDGQGDLAPAPGRLRGKVLPGGSLAVGAWAYRVTATLPGHSETVAGYTLTLTTTVGNQTVKLAWDPVPGASYSLYRSAQLGETAQTYLVAANLTATTFTESSETTVNLGKPAPDGTEPLPPGSLSLWQTHASQLNVAREGADSVLVKAVDGDPATTDEPFYIFVVGGRSNNATNTDNLLTTERALVDPVTGTLGAWTTMQGTSGPIALNSPRAFFPLVTTQGRNVVPMAPPALPPPCPDNDGDGHTGCACGGTDCDDTDATVYPGAPEICGDAKDQDCDQGCPGGADLPCGDCSVPDADGDGHVRPECGGADCNDADPAICPDPAQCPEICGDGIDQDCDGQDLPCPCITPDADNDGYNSIPCGGNDCNDNDPNICPDPSQCPEVPCDGIDQDCDGIDPCSNPDDVLFLTSLSSTPPLPTMVSLEQAPLVCTPYFPGSLSPTLLQSTPWPEEPAYLAALYGDDAYKYPGKNLGMETCEVALVEKNGDLSPWTLQDEVIMGNVRYGNDGLLYHDFAFSFRGVLSETLGDDPPVGQIWNNVYRYQIDTTAAATWISPPPATFLYDLNPAGSPLNTPRVYQSVVRLNGFIYSIAGNAGSQIGPTTTIERIKQ